MFEHLRLSGAHDALVGAIEEALASGRVRTPDLGGWASIVEMAAAMGERVPPNL